MATTKKITRNEVSEKIRCDQVTLSKGVFTARRGFFYRNGRSVQNLIDAVKAEFPEATILDSGEIWRPFRGGASVAAQSHWFVKFTL